MTRELSTSLNTRQNVTDPNESKRYKRVITASTGREREREREGEKEKERERERERASERLLSMVSVYVVNRVYGAASRWSNFSLQQYISVNVALKCKRRITLPIMNQNRNALAT